MAMRHARLVFTMHTAARRCARTIIANVTTTANKRIRETFVEIKRDLLEEYDFVSLFLV